MRRAIKNYRLKMKNAQENAIKETHNNDKETLQTIDDKTEYTNQANEDKETPQTIENKQEQNTKKENSGIGNLILEDNDDKEKENRKKVCDYAELLTKREKKITNNRFENKNDVYRLRLMSDDELKAKSEIIFTYNDLINKDRTLDSSIFGVTNIHSECQTCGGDIDTCPGHMGAIISPFPFVKVLCIESFKGLLSMICPICSKIPLDQYIQKYIISFIEPTSRYEYCKKKIEEYKTNVITCPWCHNKITFIKVIQKEPLIYMGFQVDNNSEPSILNPLALQAILQNFNQYELLGWPTTYNAGNFMSNIVPIIPNKLRIKSIDNAVSIITTFYKNLVEEIIPELGKLYKIMSEEDLISMPNNSTLLNQFMTLYNKLVAYYTLISDATSENVVNTCLNIANKNDRKHFDSGVSAIGRIKDKENSMFNKGIIGARVDASCRSVLGAAADARIMDIFVPHTVANKLGFNYPVYKENLKIMQQILASMSNVDIYNNVNIPHVLYVEDCVNKTRSKVEPSNAQTKAALLKPGDKLEISLIDSLFVQHCRFPSMREESWTSQQVRRVDGTVVAVPLSICPMKGADMDGDETQFYVNSSICYQLEALLLHSCARCMTAFKDGTMAIWWDSGGADVLYGLKKLKRNLNINIKDFKAAKPYDVLKNIEEYLPKDLNYEDDSLLIKNGKFTSDKINLNNQQFILYVKDIYGPYYALNLMDKIIQASYDINRYFGHGLGFEIAYYDDKSKKEVDAMLTALYDKMKTVEESNAKNKDIAQINNADSETAKILKILTEQAKGTSIDELGFLKKYGPEYSHVVAKVDHQKDPLTNGRLKNTIADNTRTLATFPKYSIDPCAYGYIKNGYADDISPAAHFWDCKAMRMTLYTKSGEAIGKQGYLQKRLAVSYNDAHADFNHAIVDANRIISIISGFCGTDPRKYIKQPLPDATLSRAEFIKKYKDDKELINLYDTFTTWSERWNEKTNSIKTKETYEEFASGFNWMQYIKQNLKPLSKDKIGNKNYKELINNFIKEIEDIIFPIGARVGIWSEFFQRNNILHHEYFFRVIFGYNYELTKEVYDQLLIYFNGMMVEGGETLGIKAANSISEPMSQLILKAIHGMGGGVDTDKIKRMSAFDAFETLLGGKAPKATVLTFGLYDDSKEASQKWAEEQETIYINDIWNRADIIMSNSVDEKIKELHKDEIDNFDQFDINPIMVTVNITMSKLADYHIHIVDIINKLIKSYPSIMFISGVILNSNEFKAYIYFRNDITYNEINIMVEEWSMIKNYKTLVHGGYLENCYVSENKNNPGHYVILANEISPDIMALENLIYKPEIDPYKCASTNIETMYNLYGCCEANARHIHECAYTAKSMGATKGVLITHYKLISDISFATGKYLTAERYSMKEDIENDPLKLISYETPRDFLINTIKLDKLFPASSLVSSTFFGGKTAAFSGDLISKITLYET